MNFNQLIRNLEQDNIDPLYLLVGEEVFLIREAVATLTRAVVRPEDRDFNLELLDAGESDMARVKDAIGTLPFLGGRRLVVVKNFQGLRTGSGSKGLARYFEVQDPSIVTVITAPKLDRKKKINGSLYKHAVVVEMKRLNKGEARAWITRRAKLLGKRLDREAPSYLVERVGTNLGLLNNELEKAATFVGEREWINIGDLYDLVGDLHEDSIFALTDAVGAKDLDKGLRALRNILDRGSAPGAVLGMLARQFRLVWQVKSLLDKKAKKPQILARLGLPPFMVNKLKPQAKKFSAQELRSGFEKMKELDRTLKNSDMPAHILFDNFLLKFCRRPKNG